MPEYNASGLTAAEVTALIAANGAGGGLSSSQVDTKIANALTGYATTSALSGKASSAALTALAATVPTPAVAAPPGVSDSGAVGSMPTQFAMGDHTHASRARKARVALSAATYTWAYPTAFAAGVVPICNGIAETVAGATDLFNVQIDGAPTNTQCKFRITRYQQSVASLLGLTVLSLNGTPGSITLHMTAFEP